jgi:hypothetical protein
MGWQPFNPNDLISPPPRDDGSLKKKVGNNSGLSGHNDSNTSLIIYLRLHELI